MATEPLHEIQLNGKQLVFTFMSVTVVAVVVFLCGVMVGRGVRAPRSDPGVASITQAGGADPTSFGSAPPPSPPATSADAGLAASREILSYPNRLEGKEPVEESLKAPDVPAAIAPARVADGNAVEAVARAPAPAREPVPPPAATPSPIAASKGAAPAGSMSDGPVASAAPPATARADPTGDGFVVQVAATKVRREADTIARRLAAKGFPAFVSVSTSGPQMFRVRVGTYADRHQAQTIAARLEKEEQFKPWITK